MKKSILLTVLLILGLTFISAQTIAEYTFSTTTDGTLEDMTGSTDLLAAGSYYDDTASTVTEIGFTFAFGTGSYTQFSANSNGQMQLGATAISGGSASPAANLPRLAPLSGDNAIRATGKLHYKVVGSEPNRKLVVEWLDLRVNYSSAAETGTYCRMQAWLYEGSNNIKFVYGTMWNMSTSTQARTVYVATSNITGSLGQVTDIIGAMSWNSAGTSVINTTFPASSAMPNLNSATDGTRRVFHFNYPDPSAPPSPAILLNPGNGSYAMLTDALSWGAGGGYVTSYDVYLGTSPVPPFYANVTSTTYSPVLVGGTTYYWNIVAKNANGDAAPSVTWSFRTPSSTQLVESFEATAFPPAGWANGTTGNWTRSTSYYKHGTASAYKYGSTSTAYVLSTPRLTITPTSTLDLWSLASTATGTLQVVYSSDRVTWTPLGTPITHAATYTFYNTVADLSSLAGNNYYLGIQTGLQAVSFYVDLVIGPEITPEVPGAPALSTPVNLAVNVNESPTLTWTASTTGGVPTGYRLYVDTTNPPTTMVADQTALTYTYTTPLAYNTTYYWMVEAYNGAGTGPQSTVNSFTTRENPTVNTFPWVVDFGSTGATFPPLNWSQLTGLIGEPLTAGGSWYQDDFANVVTTPPNYSGRLNIWSTSSKYWLVTPPVVIPANHELKFDLAYTTYSGTTTPAPGGQADDRFVVLISDNPSMTGATILREWNNTGSPYVYDTISNVGENHIINLGSYSGTKYIAFYGESTVSGGDNNVYVDNVTVRETPAAPIFSLSPTAWDFDQTVINTVKTKQFTIANNGGGALAINSIGISGDYYTLISNPAPVSLAGGQSATFTVQYAPTAVGTHEGTVTITDGRTVTTVDLDGGCYDPSISVFPFTESFDGDTFAPLGWTNIRTAGTSTPGIWDRQTAGTYPTCAPNSGAGMARYNAYSISSGGLAELITPPLNLPGDDYRVSFYMYRDTGYPAYVEGVNVYYNATPTATGATLLGTIHRSTILEPVAEVGWNYYAFNLPAGSAGNGRYIIFEGFSAFGNNIFIDDVMVLPQPAGGPGAPILTYPGVDAENLPKTGFNFTWTANPVGTTPTRYEFYISDNADGILESEFMWETVNNSFDPISEGVFEYYYDDVWYWTVKAINLSGSAVATPQMFTIQSDPAITTFPWNEGFENAFPPSGWTTVDVDGAGTSWAVNTSVSYIHSGLKSAKHGYSTATPDPGQDGWMITPPATIPATGNYYLSWWNYNVYPTDMVYNGVKVNTTNDPDAAGWVELWSQGNAAAAWNQAVVNIGDYAGQTVYFAFNYQGYNADDWYVDDVSVFELTIDTFGPVITHLPIINTPREDLGKYVVADIVDDATWNNPIGGASMYYSIDGGSTWSAPVAMTLDVAPTYYALIPAQALGTTVTYKIEAWDSLNNTTTTINFAYGVNDPTWIWYDQGGTTYLGYTTTNFGPVVQFNNPFYGTGNAVQLLATDGSSYYGNAADLQIYTWDGVNDLMPYFATPIPITFGAQTYDVFDLSTYNVQISAPYFFVSYLNIPMGNYILFDGTYDYGTTYVFQGTTLYTLSNPGSWAIGAYVQTGMSQALDAPVVTIASSVNGVHLDWTDVDGASSYKVFGAVDPYAADPWNLLGTVLTPGYTYTGTAVNQFFKVVADSDAPARVSTEISNTPVKINARSVKATPAPKGSIKLNNRNK